MHEVVALYRPQHGNERDAERDRGEVTSGDTTGVHAGAVCGETKAKIGNSTRPVILATVSTALVALFAHADAVDGAEQDRRDGDELAVHDMKRGEPSGRSATT
jgi:hypothetical protein